jgi:purine nucleosidase
LEDYFRDIQDKVTVLCLCPLTPLANLLREHPEAGDKIDRLLWMGGALDVAGNLDPTTLPALVANPYAEWNIFWDPAAVAYVFANTGFPIVLFPLDITNHARVNEQFLGRLMAKSKTHRFADLAYQSYRAVSGAYYCMWDTTATAYLARPELFHSPREIEVDVVTLGPLAGTLKRVPGGRRVQAITDFTNLEDFYAYMVEQLSVSSL